jgi:alpha-tubulin suppressor-like RCC1 family protein
VSGLTDVLAVAAGSNFSIALVSDGGGDGVGNDGTVWTWGDNFRGQLGNNSPVGSSNTPVQVTSENGLGSLTDVVAVAAGSSHSLAVKSDGTVWAWGYDGFGQLGDSISHPSNQSHKPVQVQDVGGSGFLTDATDIAAGAEHSLVAVSPHGPVWAWGRNEFGSLGNGSFGGNFSRPVQAIQLIGAAQVASCDLHSLAVGNADTTPPDTTIDPASVPPANSNSPSATFEFSSNELNSTFSCRRYLVGDTPPPYNTCS